MAAMLSASVLIVSDRVSRGEAEDQTGPEVAGALRRHGFHVEAAAVVPGEPDALGAEIGRLCGRSRLGVAAGGTGVGARDPPPEAALAGAAYTPPRLGGA